jgi:hypothetical protein
MQPFAHDFAVHDVGYFEIAEFETIDGGLHFALHRRGHADLLGDWYET